MVLVTPQEQQQEKEKEASEKEGQGRRTGNFRTCLFLICLEFNNFLASEIGHIIFFFVQENGITLNKEIYCLFSNSWCSEALKKITIKRCQRG